MIDKGSTVWVANRPWSTSRLTIMMEELRHDGEQIVDAPTSRRRRRLPSRPSALWAHGRRSRSREGRRSWMASSGALSQRRQ
jgi:hypothetical protein